MKFPYRNRNYKKNQMEILKVKIMISEIKILLNGLNADWTWQKKRSKYLEHRK